jgi:putative endonuclease
MRKPPTNLSRGREAEERACHHLLQQGLTLTERNYRSPFGEIDLVMQERDTLVFVEVRYRARGDFTRHRRTLPAKSAAGLQESLPI